MWRRMRIRVIQIVIRHIFLFPILLVEKLFFPANALVCVDFIVVLFPILLVEKLFFPVNALAIFCIPIYIIFSLSQRDF